MKIVITGEVGKDFSRDMVRSGVASFKARLESATRTQLGLRDEDVVEIHLKGTKEAE